MRKENAMKRAVSGINTPLIFLPWDVPKLLHSSSQGHYQVINREKPENVGVK